MQSSGVDDLQRELGQLFGSLSRLAVERQRTGPAALSRGDFSVLTLLERDGTRRGRELAACEGSDPSTMSRRLASLEERGLIAREADPRDGRASPVRLTGPGRDALAGERSHRARTMAECLAAWAPADLGELTRLLRRLNQSLALPGAEGPSTEEGAS